MANLERLIDILSLRRPHGSDGEAELIERYIAPLAPEVMANDKGEVLAYVIRKGSLPVLWSCHIDTVHRDNDKTVRQEVWLTDDGVAFVGSDADCLGADDGAGFWLLLEMLSSGVEGTYVFHRGEEIGCWGSRQMTEYHRSFIESFTHAIAFDRKGTTSIITHQRGGMRACSDALGNKLISLLDMGHELDQTGIYTDTAEYMEIVPECVNISVGYSDEHTSTESLDTEYLVRLRDAVCSIDWVNAALPVERDPSKVEYRDVYDVYGFGNVAYRPSKGSKMLDPAYIPSYKELLAVHHRDLVDWVEAAHPDDVAYLIGDLLDQIVELSYAADEGGYRSETYLDVGMH